MRINPCQGFIDVKDIIVVELGRACDVVGRRYKFSRIAISRFETPWRAIWSAVAKSTPTKAWHGGRPRIENLPRRASALNSRIPTPLIRAS
ncbi:hypothetical protein [Nocardia sp. NBC_00403]|uniref:hypothetical protein n=1 Tax=Nocardia sp. NBC_00403 TaxID=2975990 RepID=UPI002E24F539